MKYEILKKYFNYDSFRDGQEEIVDSILKKENVLAILPTGGGKSLCFQVPGLIFDGMTLVISPLISLMEDQVLNLNKKNISAKCLNSNLDYFQSKRIEEDIKNNKIKFLYVSPEKLESPRFKNLISNLNISQITIDEAHCISMWGHDFRKAYKKITDFILFIKSKPVISAFTATANYRVINDIKESLKIDFKVIKTGFDRPNLYYEVIESQNKLLKLFQLLNDKDSTIIYVLTIKDVNYLYENLLKKGFRVTQYHSKLDKEMKEYYNELFLSDKANIMIATNAYGMGIDKSDIRLIINYGFPLSLEDLSQQQGRGSRDGKKGKCILLYSMKDLKVNEYFINYDDKDLTKEENFEIKKVKKEKLKEVVEYAKTKRCLHEFLVSHFGQLYISYCNNCSNCQRYVKEIEVINDAKLIIKAVIETNQSFGASMIALILCGSKDEKIKRLKLNKIKTYNKTLRSISEIKEIISYLISDDYLERTPDLYPVLKLTKKSLELLELDSYKIKL